MVMVCRWAELCGLIAQPGGLQRVEAPDSTGRKGSVERNVRAGGAQLPQAKLTAAETRDSCTDHFLGCPTPCRLLGSLIQ